LMNNIFNANLVGWLFCFGLAYSSIPSSPFLTVVCILEWLYFLFGIFLITPLMAKSAKWVYVSLLLCYANCSFLWYAIVYAACFLKNTQNNQFVTVLNLTYPDNYIVFGFALAFIPVIWIGDKFFLRQMDMRQWYEVAKLPGLIDLTNNMTRIRPWARFDDATDKMEDKISEKYVAIEDAEKAAHSNLLTKLLGKLGISFVLLLAVVFSGAQFWPFILTGMALNTMLIVGAIYFGVAFYIGALYYWRRLKFQYYFEKDVGKNFAPTDEIPNYKPEMNENIIISKEPVNFPKGPKYLKYLGLL